MKITIHVGLTKAASTYLQNLYLPTIPDVTFVHAPYRPPVPPNPIQRFVHELLFRNSVHLDTKAFRREIADYLNGCGKSRAIISCEALFGMPFANHSGFRSNADVLAEVFDHPQIWLVLRRQDRWLESTYSQFLKMGLSTSPQRFTNFREGKFSGYRWIYGGPNLDVRDLDWTPFVEYYQHVFGPQRVLVQVFEQFVRDREGFLSDFCEFAGVKPHLPPAGPRVNASLSPVSAAVARLANSLPMSIKLGLKRYVPSHMHPARILNRTLDPVWGRRRLFPAALSEAALRLHHGNNRRLGERLGVDLAADGYY